MAHQQTGRVYSWFAMALGCIIVSVLYGYWAGYRIPIRTHVATKPVTLYGDAVGMVEPIESVIGSVLPGERCRFIQVAVAVEMMFTYRVMCGDLNGWTDSGSAFAPRLDPYEPF
ncbi:hypothetical protein [Cupriavidus campinensis]